MSGRTVVSTAAGEAWIDLDAVRGKILLAIGHGAGGTVDSPDLVAIRDHCVTAGISVARITQPYRVAGRKAPPTASVLDAAWRELIAELGRLHRRAGRKLIFAGRSSGARVACRTAQDPAVKPVADGVVAVAFPVHPPGKPEKSRLEELTAVGVPVLIVQGDRDPFGHPGPSAENRTVVTVAGDHSLKRSADEVGAAVAAWLLSRFR